EEQIAPAVVVEIAHSQAPSGQWASLQLKPRRLRDVLEERPLADISKKQKSVVHHAGDDQVGQPVVIEIAEVRTHPGDRLAVIAQCHAGFESAFLECAVAAVVKQKAAHGIVGDEYIGEAIPV